MKVIRGNLASSVVSSEQNFTVMLDTVILSYQFNNVCAKAKKFEML